MLKFKSFLFFFAGIVLTAFLVAKICCNFFDSYIFPGEQISSEVLSAQAVQNLTHSSENRFGILPLNTGSVMVILKIDGNPSTKQLAYGENLTVTVDSCRAITGIECAGSEYIISKDGKSATVYEIRQMLTVTVTTEENHNFSQLVSVEKEATCISDGIGTFSCSECGLYREGMTIPATGKHNTLPEYGVAPVETVNGENWIRLVCKDCGHCDYRYMSDGNYVTSRSVEFDDGVRFFGENGNMVTGSYDFSDGRTGIFSETGLITDGWIMKGSCWNYFAGGVKALGITVIDSDIYCFTAECGTLITSKAEVVSVDGVLSVGYFGIDGKLTEKVAVTDNEKGCWIRIAGRTMYIKDGKYAKGKTEIDSQWYWFNSYGRRAENSEEIVDGKLYGFDGSGIPFEVTVGENGLADVNGKIVCVDENLIVKSDFREINGITYYFNTVGRLMTDTIESVNGQLYLIKTDGSCTAITADGYYNTGNKTMRVYQGKVAKSEWIGDEYYNSVGRRTENVAVVIGQELAEFDSDGKLIGKIDMSELADGFSDALGTGRRVFISNGKAVTGWFEIGGKSYYANSEYRVLRNTVEVIDGILYKFGSGGEVENQLSPEGNGWQFVDFSDRLICIKPDGTLARSEWVTRTVADVGTFEVYANSMYRILCDTVSVIDGVLCEFDSYGRATKTELSAIAGNAPSPTETGRVIYVDSEGRIRTGFVRIDGDLYYFNSCYRMMVSCVLTVDGKQYVFDSDGKCINDNGEDKISVTGGAESNSLNNGTNVPLKAYVSDSYLEIMSLNRIFSELYAGEKQKNDL